MQPLLVSQICVVLGFDSLFLVKIDAANMTVIADEEMQVSHSTALRTCKDCVCVGCDA